MSQKWYFIMLNKWFNDLGLLKASLILPLHPILTPDKRRNNYNSCERKEKRNHVTCCSIALNRCSIGLHAAEMTGSLCRHTAASKFHGEVAFSTTLLLCKASRQNEVLKPRRKPLFLAQVPRKWERIGVTARPAAIFLCCVQGPYERKRRSWKGY